MRKTEAHILIFLFLSVIYVYPDYFGGMIRGLSLQDSLVALSAFAAPRECIVCGTALALHERFLCVHCLADLPRTHYSDRSHNPLADRFNHLIQKDVGTASEQDSGLEKYAYATALFYYRSSTGYRSITQRLKYHSDLSSGRYFSSLLAKELQSSPLFSDVDCVIPVPLHWSRLWSRGYNQSEVIAREIAGALGARLSSDILFRQRRTRTQTRLSIVQKSINVEGAFRVRQGKAIKTFSHILLVDDVFTTGATLHSCFRALRSAFPASVRISVATLACVAV